MIETRSFPGRRPAAGNLPAEKEGLAQGIPGACPTFSATAPVSPRIFCGPQDAMLLAGEWLARQIYWRNQWLRNWLTRRKVRKTSVKQIAQREQLVDYLQKIGVCPGSLVMAHTSTSGVRIENAAAAERQPTNAMQVASELLSILLELVGDSGTLVMPTNPDYGLISSAGSTADPQSLPVYNPRSTPCRVGLTNELFWRKRGTLRSLCPHNPLAARGPLAEDLLMNNLNESRPLPHGVDSGYFRFQSRNGLLVSIGIPLSRYLTLSHVAEESLDRDWSVPDFFEERNYLLRHDGEDRVVTIRQTRPEFMKFSLCNRKLRRDLRREGIVHEGFAGTLKVDWARSGDVVQFLSERNRSTTYPYFFTSLAPRRAAG